jgi:hypothetical protein
MLANNNLLLLFLLDVGLTQKGSERWFQERVEVVFGSNIGLKPVGYV